MKGKRVILTQKLVDDLIDMAKEPWTMTIKTGNPNDKLYFKNPETQEILNSYRTFGKEIEVPAPLCH